MLKGLILAGLLIAIWVLVQGTVFQLRAPQKAFASMVAWFAPMVPAFVLLYVLTPADLGFLPERFARAAPALGLLNGLAMLVLLFLTGGALLLPRGPVHHRALAHRAGARPPAAA